MAITTPIAVLVNRPIISRHADLVRFIVLSRLCRDGPRGRSAIAGAGIVGRLDAGLHAARHLWRLVLRQLRL